MRIFGYKPNGDACLFDLGEGELLPPGWSGDYRVIEDASLRTAEAITEACGASIVHPVKPGPGAFLHSAPVVAVAPYPAAKAPRRPAAKPGRKKTNNVSPEERARRSEFMKTLRLRRRVKLSPVEPVTDAP